MKRNRTTLVGVLCGIVCAACVLAYMQGVRGEVDTARAEALARYGGEQLEVCVAKRDIVAGETVGTGDIETRLWVVDLLPSEAFRSVDEVVGKKASSAILAGEVLSARRFRESGAELNVPAGLTAVSVPAKNVQAVGGALTPGSRVDMYATGGTSTDLVAGNVVVLATSAGAREGLLESDVSWITVAVEPHLAQEIVAAAQKTELYFTLPGVVAKDDASADGDVQDGSDESAAQ